MSNLNLHWLWQFLSKQTLRKVPEVLLLFWIIKLLTTALGESTSDYLVHTLNHPVIAVALGGTGFIIAMILQLWIRHYIAWIYWLAVTMVAIFGTMAADVIHIGLGVPYLISTIFFSIALTIIFIVWYLNERTLSIHSIFNRRRELFYWATVLTTFALGTAAGDMTAITFRLGYFDAGILFAFWFAYIVTRPLGASYADWFGRSHELGGIGLGTGKTSITLAILIILFVVYLTITKNDIKRS